MKEGVQHAAQSIDSGAALEKLRALVNLSRELAAPKA
jgi:anthranilate phosphoribosyltransferase